MNETQLKALEQQYQTWPTAQLVRATTVEKQDYEPFALDLMAQEVRRRGISKSEMETVEDSVQKQAENDKMRLYGIKGFLLLFVIFVPAGSLILAFWGFDLWRVGAGLFPVASVLALLLAGYGLYAFRLLIRKECAAPKHAQWFLILIFLLNLFVLFSTWQLTQHLQLGPVGVGITPLLWLGYLSWSRRVAATYCQSPGAGKPPNR